MKTVLYVNLEDTKNLINLVEEYNHPFELPRPKERGFLFHWKQP